jgi:hypothetical protein
MLVMEVFESSVSVEQSIEFIKQRTQARQTTSPGKRFRRSAATDLDARPTKNLDALVLGNSLVGYGDKITAENMAIIENLITMSKMEASYAVPGGKDPKAWFREFHQCMKALGCFVPDEGYTKYGSASLNLTLDNIIVDIVQTAADAAKAAIPGASVLSAIADSTLSALKKEPEALNLLNLESKNIEGVRLSAIPCEQMANGIILIAVASVDHRGGGNDGGVLFVDWRTSTLDIFQGRSFVTFNPAKYAANQSLIEAYVDEHRRELLKKRFSRRK